MAQSEGVNRQAELAHEFVERLGGLREFDRGALAILRRGAGEALGSARGAAAVFYPLLPYGVGRWQEGTYFLVASLYALNERGHKGDFGATMRDASANSGSADLRMKALLDSEYDPASGGGELAYRLRQAVKLARSREVGVNWEALIRHLGAWSSEQRWVQREWARSYFGREMSADGAAGTIDEGVENHAG